MFWERTREKREAMLKQLNGRLPLEPTAEVLSALEMTRDEYRQAVGRLLKEKVLSIRR
jgi:hypothetical protein